MTRAGSSGLLQDLSMAPVREICILVLFGIRPSDVEDTMMLKLGGNSFSSYILLKVAIGISMKSKSLRLIYVQPS